MKRTIGLMATAAWMAFPALLLAQAPAPGQTQSRSQSQTQTQNQSQPQAGEQTASAHGATAAAPTAAKTNQLILPAGATLHVRLTTTLTSKTNKSGDKFTGIVTDPVSSGDKVVVPEGSLVEGHVAFVKSSGRVSGRAQMRVVLDSVSTPDEQTFQLSAGLQDAGSDKCTKANGDGEGTLKGCGKSKKEAAKDAAIVGAIGASGGASVGIGSEIDCRYYGNCGGPGIGESVGYGAAIGAGTALIYNLFKHEKQLILVEGTSLSFVVNRSVNVSESETPAPAGDADSQ